MLIPFHKLILLFNLKITGILHVGAHECEELKDYEKYIKRDKILWIEAIPEKVEWCLDNFSNIKIENALVSDKIEDINFNISNNGQSSSFLNFGLHSKHHPCVHYTNQIKMKSQLLKDILVKYNDIQFNFINLDIQGTELRALKGMEEYLKKDINYIYTEVNNDYVYENCNLITELDEYLKQFNFVRVMTKWTEYNWGDAFYIKIK